MLKHIFGFSVLLSNGTPSLGVSSEGLDLSPPCCRCSVIQCWTDECVWVDPTMIHCWTDEYVRVDPTLIQCWIDERLGAMMPLKSEAKG